MPYYQLVIDDIDICNRILQNKPQIIYAYDKKDFFKRLLNLNLIEPDLINDIFSYKYENLNFHLNENLKGFLHENRLILNLSKNHESIVELHRIDNSKIIFPECFYENKSNKSFNKSIKKSTKKVSFPFEEIWSIMCKILGECGDVDFGRGGYASRDRYYSFIEVDVIN